ncbi:aminotransferase [Salinarimonas rosea]|uniref:aminotransferase n=1 Tax=Salinarimonas rosea TaxID=552063 RepID=UPI000425651D|nr:aminotransferase [Salinarimonas rosea]
MSPRLSPAVAAIQSPPIPEAQGWARAYAGAHGPLIDLSQAAPGGAPHPALLARLAEAAGSADAARYGPILGDDTLRGALAADVSRLYGGPVAADDVAITAGCNAAFVTTMLAIAAPGDAVLLPTPWYFNHEMTLAMLGIEARPLPCRAQDGFVPRPEDAEALVDARVRAIVLVTPNNPTGAIYPPDTIAAFADLARRRGLWLVVDETYRDFLPLGSGAPHGLFGDAGRRAGVVHLYSFSKSYAVPGHRLGALVAGPELVAAAGKILDNVQICPARAGQAAVAWAIEALRPWREEARATLEARADAFAAALAPLPGWEIASIGPYFAYVRHPWPGTPAAETAKRLAVERGVLMLPGSFFGPGQEDYLRVAFANVDAQRLAMVGERLGAG